MEAAARGRLLEIVQVQAASHLVLAAALQRYQGLCPGHLPARHLVLRSSRGSSSSRQHLVRPWQQQQQQGA
jgi:hypothetical protein